MLVSSMEAKALALIALGYRVFPLKNNSRVPALGNGCKGATDDPLQVAIWWGAKPNLNIGIALTTDTVVIDVDVKKEDGKKSITEFGVSPSSVAVKTTTGGEHWYYSTSKSWRNAVGVLPGVDIRSDGGYVVAPGSVIGGRVYEGLLSPADKLPPVTDRLLELRKQAHTRDENAQVALVELDIPENIVKARKFLLASKPAVEGEGGDAWTYATAVKVRGYGISEDICLNLLVDNWNERCEPPWDIVELEAKVSNAYAYANSPPGIDAPTRFNEQLVASVGDRVIKPAEPVVYVPRLLTPEKQDLLPPPTWLVNNVLPAGSQSVSELYGPYGSFKSFMALDIACSVATGEPWAGNEVKTVGPVIYMAYEGAYGVRQRRVAWEEDKGIRPHQFLLWSDALPRFRHAEECVKDILGVLEKECAHPTLIIVDTRSRAASGMRENDADDMSLLLDMFMHLSEFTKCPILTIHHTGKDTSKGARGSTAFSAGCSTLLHTVDYDAATKYVHVQVERHKDADSHVSGWAFQLEQLGPSLIPRMRAPRRSNNDFTLEIRVSAIQEILKDANGAKLSNAALADEMANRLNEGDPVSKGRHNKALRNAIERKTPELKSLWERDGGLILWRIPELDLG